MGRSLVVMDVVVMSVEHDLAAQQRDLAVQIA
jgi:hypothetical protein